VARRHEVLSEEITELDAQLDRLVPEALHSPGGLPPIGSAHHDAIAEHDGSISGIVGTNIN
jgi:hypothetical protein